MRNALENLNSNIMNPKITLTDNNLNKEVIASNIIQHDFITTMVSKGKKNFKKPLVNQTSPFGEFPDSFLNKKSKENANPKKKGKDIFAQ